MIHSGGGRLLSTNERKLKGKPNKYIFGHYPRKLTSVQVQTLRNRYLAGGITQRELCAEYGVSIATMTHLLMGDTYQDVN